MVNSKPPNQELIGEQLTEDILQILKISLGEGAAACHVCGSKLREGDSLTAYAFRPADKPTFNIGHLKCTDDRHEPTEHFTLGVRELVVEGRVGTCSDQATQSSWPVLLGPRPRVVSPPDTTEAHPLAGTAWTRRRIEASETYAAADACTARHPWQRVVRRVDTSTESDTNPDPSTPRADGGILTDPDERPLARGQPRWSLDG